MKLHHIELSDHADKGNLLLDVPLDFIEIPDWLVDNGGDPYSVTPANLAAELSAIKATGVSVQTMSQALAEIKAQP